MRNGKTHTAYKIDSTRVYWAGSHQGKMVDGDVHDIASLAQALYMSFFCLHDSVINNAVELTQRRVIDDIVEMAFRGRMESIHSVV